MNLKFNTYNLNIQIEENILLKLPIYAQSPDASERGGVLMGELYPNRNLVVVTNIIESPSKSNKKYSYEMNVSYIQNEINDIWKNSNGVITYLGDWHTHPEFNPKPSLRDYYTFSKNYFNSSIDQNFLLYMILGLNSNNNISTWLGVCNGFRTKKQK